MPPKKNSSPTPTRYDDEWHHRAQAHKLSLSFSSSLSFTSFSNAAFRTCECARKSIDPPPPNVKMFPPHFLVEIENADSSLVVPALRISGVSVLRSAPRVLRRFPEIPYSALPLFPCRGSRWGSDVCDDVMEFWLKIHFEFFFSETSKGRFRLRVAINLSFLTINLETSFSAAT